MTLPTIHPIGSITFSLPEEVKLNNNIKLYGFNGVQNDVLRLDLVFDAGRWTEVIPLQSEFVAKLLKSGTSTYTSFEISEMIDSLGSTIKVGSGYNSFTVSVYCMNRYLEETLNYVLMCLNDCAFPESELNYQQRKSIANLQLALEKNDYIADVEFKKQLFGDEHPYGYSTTKERIEHLQRAHLFDYYNHQICADNCTVFIAGKYGNRELEIIGKSIGNWNKISSTDKIASKYTINKSLTSTNNLRIKKEKSVQASIVIGNTLFNKSNKDYSSFILLNTIFGGYFSSRLMSNIREEKGLTYGIHSSLFSLRHDGIFSIQTDTNLENLELCLDEIYREMKRLQNELIPEEEIELARNYLLGKFLNRTDGPFNQMDTFKSYFIENVNIHKFSEIVETIKVTDAVSLQQLAQQYLQKENMTEIIVG